MKKAIYFFSIIFSMLLLFTACKDSSADLIENENFVVVKSGSLFNAEDINILVGRIQEIKEGNKDFFIVNNSGKYKTSKYIKNIPSDTEGIKSFINDNQEDIRIVEKGKYRVTTWKKEIDGAFNNERYVGQITRDEDNIAMSSDLSYSETRDKFIKETNELHTKQDYKSIIEHIEDNEYIVFDLEKDTYIEVVE